MTKQKRKELLIRALQFGNKTATETSDEPFVHALQVDWWSVARQNNPLARTEEMVEDMEESILSPWGSHPLLYIIDNEHVDGLVEVDEIIEGVESHGIGVLHLEKPSTDIQHSLLGIEFLYPYTNGIDEMSLSTP